ncbi:metalloregulator ArsR/SmtB family transcription factor [Curtobacterium pusillum]|uniref:Helix-turn-helix transcriptional regulator n=1 Tax=Curtobacterium pusillum TaxID=69373 RepID=A0ABX2MBT9_9MICO|nr:metalloregulator ArsR/SmtB family transcription factor [Curtobacterium pusillum]NUU14953.1 helix-turn-helix transcriptional regulator [Curtobacterium pusillum]GLK32516.1 transcriptional regulator [Curtobacterium pusillum]
METDRIDVVLSALADPIRRRIVERLGKGEATVTDLSVPFDVSAPAISRHLGVLERAGLITRERHGTWRTCRLQPEAVDELGTWLGGLQPVWDRRFDSLEAVLAAQRDHTRVVRASSATPTVTTDSQEQS